MASVLAYTYTNLIYNNKLESVNQCCSKCFSFTPLSKENDRNLKIPMPSKIFGCSTHSFLYCQARCCQLTRLAAILSYIITIRESHDKRGTLVLSALSCQQLVCSPAVFTSYVIKQIKIEETRLCIYIIIQTLY